MDDTASPRRPRRTIIVLTVAAVLAAALIGVDIYGLAHGPTGPNSGSEPNATASASRPAVPMPIAAPKVRETANPQGFARDVATALFAWDTATPKQPSDYMQALVEVGDPTGQETAGLADDLTTYYPTSAQWAGLRGYQTRQRVTIATVTVPSSWPQALQEAKGSLPTGTLAYSITGTRHRAGIWNGKPVTSSEPVSFTVFETCKPTFTECRLLRLSRLGNPLP